jgi:hypothetical protein
MYGPKSADGWPAQGMSLKGADGEDGEDGTNGQDGDAGAIGADGDDGAEGAQGPAGPQGPAGAKGDTGAAGATGSQGPAGEVGPAGAAGPAGPAGPTGAAGPAGPNTSLLGGSVSSATANQTTYSAPFMGFTSSTQSSIEQRMPVGGTLDQFAIRLSNDPGSSPNSWAFTVMNATTASTVTCSISGTGVSCNDLTHSVSFAAGDLLSIRLVPNSDPDNTSVRWTARFTAAP